jgi:superfamily I DNA/RNA helicase/RecB family exonuclease
MSLPGAGRSAWLSDGVAPTPTYRLVRRVAPVGPPPVLDAAQAAVVAHRVGPLLVLGGPGTGKTTALVEAVAARVADGVEPDRVLVLTFGRRAAAALRNRIEARLGRRAAGGAATMTEPVVRTFPGYAFGLLRRAAAEGGQPAPRLLTGAEQDALIREMLADPEAADRVGWPRSLRPALRTRAFAGELRDLLLRAAERAIGPRTLADLGRAHRRDDWVAAARFLREYQQVLALRDASTRGSVGYDQAELVRAAGALLVDDAALLAGERERYRVVYVDELADTDPAQIDLLGLVAGGGVPIVGFADPDSSTFSFRGADPTGVADFTDRFRTAGGDEAPRLILGVGYRARAELLAATRRVAARLRGPVAHRALTPGVAGGADGQAGGDPLPALEVCTVRTLASESAYVAHRLREAHLYHGVPWSRMAVIVRSLRRQHAPLRRALAQAGVPTTTAAEDTALATVPVVAHLLLVLRCALDESALDEEAAVALLHSPLGGADPLVERALRQGLRAVALATGDRRPSGDLLVAALRDPTELLLVQQRWARPAQRVADLLGAARQAAWARGATPESVLWAVWRTSGLTERWAAASARGGPRGAAADRDLDAVMVLFDAAAAFTDRLPGARVEAFLDHLLDQQLPVDTLAPTAERGEAVRVLTAHAAKGLEWEVVAVTGVQEGVWPDLRLRGSVLGSERLVDLAAGRATGTASQVSALLDEERRLFYVACTRARRSLLVTAVDASSAGDGGGEEQPSRFLNELAQNDEPDPAPASSGPGSDATQERAPISNVTQLARPLTLAGFLAELRTVAADEASPPARRRAAAAQLAGLAQAGVPGADPDEWWGLRPLSDERPLVDAGAPVRVSPSTVESVQRCGLRWLLERHGGSEPPSAKQTIGNLVHAAAMLAHDAGTDPAVLRDYVAQRFDAVEVSARWLGPRERARAEQMVEKLVGWLARNPRRLIAVEREFLRELEGAAGPVQLRGRVDRLEMDADGRLVVVDLKTGASVPSTEDVAVHPQLAAYQLAVREGAFAEGSVPGGAEIVALGNGGKTASVRAQPPLAEADDPEWAAQMVRGAAAAMAAATFEAVVNKTCAYCPVRTSCPVSGQGRQVTQG